MALPFRVTLVSSESEYHPASELELACTSVFPNAGWCSARQCNYPQELEVRFREEVHIRRVRILVHESRIPRDIMLYVGTASASGGGGGPGADGGALSGTSTATTDMRRLGHVTFSDNADSEYQAREQKYVSVNERGMVLRVVMHECHANPLNRFGQVGIVSLQVEGRPTQGAPLLPNQVPDAPGSAVAAAAATPRTQQQAATNQLLRDERGRRRDADSYEVVYPRATLTSSDMPSNWGQASVVDRVLLEAGVDVDLVEATQPAHRVDTTTHRIVEQLTRKKAEAAARDDFAAAKRLKETIVEVLRVGSEVVRLERVKARAIQGEDYDAAAEVKGTIRELEQHRDRLPRAHDEQPVHATQQRQQHDGDGRMIMTMPGAMPHDSPPHPGSSGRGVFVGSQDREREGAPPPSMFGGGPPERRSGERGAPVNYDEKPLTGSAPEDDASAAGRFGDDPAAPQHPSSAAARRKSPRRTPRAPREPRDQHGHDRAEAPPLFNEGAVSVRRRDDGNDPFRRLMLAHLKTIGEQEPLGAAAGGAGALGGRGDGEWGDGASVADVLGSTVVACVSSRKRWQLREAALHVLGENLAAVAGAMNVLRVFKMVCVMLFRGLSDRNPQVYICAVGLLCAVFEEQGKPEAAGSPATAAVAAAGPVGPAGPAVAVGHKLAKGLPPATPQHPGGSKVTLTVGTVRSGEVLRGVQTVLPVIVRQTAASNARVRGSSSDAILFLARQPHVGPSIVAKHLHIGTGEMSKSWRMVCGSLRLLITLVREFGFEDHSREEAGEDHSQHPRGLMFGRVVHSTVEALQHQNGDIRHAALDLLVLAYTIMGRRVEPFLRPLKPFLLDLLRERFMAADTEHAATAHVAEWSWHDSQLIATVSADKLHKAHHASPPRTLHKKDRLSRSPSKSPSHSPNKSPTRAPRGRDHTRRSAKPQHSRSPAKGKAHTPHQNTSPTKGTGTKPNRSSPHRHQEDRSGSRSPSGSRSGSGSPRRQNAGVERGRGAKRDRARKKSSVGITEKKVVASTGKKKSAHRPKLPRQKPGFAGGQTTPGVSAFNVDGGGGGGEEGGEEVELAKNAEADAADVEGASNAAIDVAAEKGGDNTKTEGRIGAEKHDRSDGESGENTGKGVAAASTPKKGGPGGEDKANGKAEDRDDEAKVKDGGDKKREEDAKAKEDTEAMTKEATDEKTKKEAGEKGKEEAESKVNEGEKKKEENPPPKKKKGFCAIL
jgi:centrosomal protein CEP104